MGGKQLGLASACALAWMFLATSHQAWAQQAEGQPAGNPIVGKWMGDSKAYLFRPDGTYEHMIAGSGTMISGVAIDKGQFILSGNMLTLRQTHASFVPSAGESRPGYQDKPRQAVEQLQILMPDSQTLIALNRFGVRETYHRSPQ